MTKAPPQLVKQVLSLPPDARADLVEQVISSLDDAEQSEIDRAWAEEAERRMRAIEAGDMEVVDGAEVLKKASPPKIILPLTRSVIGV